MHFVTATRLFTVCCGSTRLADLSTVIFLVYWKQTMRTTALLLGAVACAFAQDPYKVAPDNYKAELENQYVRVSRVTYHKGEHTAEHAHPSIPTVYVYLTDGGPIRFAHKKPLYTIERKAVSAGQIRFNRNAHVETHETDYLGNEPAEYLRIELKTKTNRAAEKDARLKVDSDFPWEDEQIRISKALAPTARPSVLVDVAGKSFRWLEPNSAPPATAQAILIEIK